MFHLLPNGNHNLWIMTHYALCLQWKVIDDVPVLQRLLDFGHHGLFLCFPFFEYLLACFGCNCILELTKTEQRSSYAVGKFRTLDKNTISVNSQLISIPDILN